MRTISTHYEQHILTDCMGSLHLLSDAPIDTNQKELMLDAARVLYHQYGAGGVNPEGEQIGALIYVQSIPQIDGFMKESVPLHETYGDVYLGNPFDLLKFYKDNPTYHRESFLMSESIYSDFHRLLKSGEELTFALTLQRTFNNEGLFYAVIEG